MGNKKEPEPKRTTMKGLDGNRITAGETRCINWLIEKHQKSARALGIIVREQK